MDLTAIAGCSLKFNKSVLLAMKLTAILLLAAVLQVSARSYSQTITISAKEIRVDKLFNELKTQTGYSFLWDEQVLSRNQRVTIDVKGGSLEQVMEQCLKNLPLTYKIEQKVVFILKKAAPAIDTSNFSPPPGSIKGKVLAEDGSPLAGATVTVKSTGKGTITNAKGEFSLPGVTENSSLVISFVGYTSRKIEVKDASTIEVRLSVAVNELDESVVQAYGTTTKRFSTGNIGRVTAAEIERQPVINPLLALQGKIAGLDVSQTNGLASAPIKVELRGRNVIGNFPSDPLYIIDGVPLTILEVGNNSSYARSTGVFQFGGGFNGPASGRSPLFDLNPADIESIEVLKDADATAIYGSRAANGVIIISTKRGKAGKTKLDLRVQHGITEATRYYPLMNTKQYLSMRREAFYNDSVKYGIVPDAGNAYDLLVWDTTRYTNWQKQLYGGMGKVIDAEASVSGGDVNTTFRAAVGYNRTTNILAVSGADERGSLSFNVTHHTLDHKVTISLSGTYSSSKSDMISLPGTVSYAPNAPAIYDSAGNLNFQEWNASGYYPFSTLKQPYDAKSDLLNGNLVLSYQPVKGLSFSTSVGYNANHASLVSLSPISSQDPATDPKGSAIFGNTVNKNWLIEPQVSYDMFLSKGKLKFFVGSSYQQTTTQGGYVAGGGYTSDALLHTISNAPAQNAYDNFGEYKYAAVFARISYNWQNKYLINLNARRDGSSRFGDNNQFGNFASVGAAWIFTEESWIRNNLSFLSFGKIRASYGTTGGDAVGDYKYLTRWSSQQGQPYGGIIPIRPTQHANPYFQWQVNKKLEAAIDLGFLKDRIILNVAYYRNRCGNQLVAFPLPYLTGFGNVTANSPALVQNDGWEFLLSTRLIDNKNFTWTFNFNTAINNNKLVAYDNIEASPYASTLVVGKPLNIVKLLHYTGVDPQTGLYTFYDKNHDGEIRDDPGSPLGDLFVHNLSPKFFGGFGTDFRFKNISVGLYFNYRKQLGLSSLALNNFPGTIANQAASLSGKQWQKPGDKVSVARFTTVPDITDSYFQFESDGAYTDASFVRLSNISVSYDLPAALIHKAGIERCTVYMRTNNLFTITSYKGGDPETQNFGGIPPFRTIVGGISFNF